MPQEVLSSGSTTLTGSASEPSAAGRTPPTAVHTDLRLSRRQPTASRGCCVQTGPAPTPDERNTPESLLANRTVPPSAPGRGRRSLSCTGGEVEADPIRRTAARSRSVACSRRERHPHARGRTAPPPGSRVPHVAMVFSPLFRATSPDIPEGLQSRTTGWSGCRGKRHADRTGPRAWISTARAAGRPIGNVMVRSCCSGSGAEVDLHTALHFFPNA